jgi:hypothetical protein
VGNKKEKEDDYKVKKFESGKGGKGGIKKFQIRN